MGLNIDRSTFSDADYEHAGQRLRDNLRALRMLLARPDFGRGPNSLGAEVEFSIIDGNADALPLNREVLAESLDPHLQLELDRFNLEYNLSAVAAAGTPFTRMRSELDSAFADLNRITADLGGRVITVGILPTLRLDQLQSDAMTDRNRYRALQAGIRRIRQEDFHIRIDGEDPLDVRCDSVTVEGANTSFQLHLRVAPDEFAACYNAAQLMTPLALAVGANSPFFLGHRLWDETRIALFKQAVDTRRENTREWRRAARVPFGHGWVRNGAFELFAESCYLYPILIPVCDDEDGLAVVEAGGTPKLRELRLHQGTIWNWNRPVYDAAGDGHLRIELRALPAGPTPVDMLANAAYLIGMTYGMRNRMDTLMTAMPFRYAEYNFYRAAQHGLDAELVWPSLRAPSPVARPVVDLCREHVQAADEGLDELGIEAAERRQLLQIIHDRLDSGTTGARWQQRALRARSGESRSVALASIVDTYLAHAASGKPVSEWD